MAEKKFHKRGFFTLLTALSLLAMTITGIVLYIVPHGRIAYWTDWRLTGLTKSDWTNIHTVSWFLFLIAGAFHIYYNWNALVSYVLNKVTRGISLKRELTISILIFCFVILSGFYQIPPLKYVIDLNEYVKKSWIKSSEYEPPFGHAEQLSLKAFAKKMNIDLELAMEELKKNGIIVERATDSLNVIAKRNRTSPMNIYKIIKKIGEKEPVSVYTQEMVEEKFAGTGLGRKTLMQICEENSIDITYAKKKLSARKMDIKETETFKEAAERYDTVPIKIMKIILVNGNNK